MSSLQWLDRPVLDDPVALIAFEGWGDAGDSASLAAIRVLEAFHSELVATIDPDEHYDFQVRRPMVVLEEGGTRRIDWPENEIHVIRRPDHDLVVVIGEEPNYKWKAFTKALVDALVSLGVTRAVMLGAFIGQVAHTLPVPLIGTATRPDTLALHGLLPSGYQGPTGILGVLGQALGNAGIDVVSVWAAVPHYLSNQDYPPAVEALTAKASELLEAAIDIGDLSSKSRQFRDTVDEAIEANLELQQYVEQLENEAVEEGVHLERLVEEIEDFLKDR
ncbi:MAG TPA: PAC2 family protein [Acidimicrobiia bacterium]|jgi:proteasome assembly chaperone (PAC2) family protein|nr:PAC2 family protein [Acidimicrobiia bacterium]